MKKLYAAYGSNMNVDEMLERCPEAELTGTSILKGYELVFRGVPGNSYLTVETKENESVPLAIWKVSEDDERNLDFYEGYPDFYYKKEFTLPVEDIQSNKVNEQKVFLYVMNPDYAPIARPSNYYLASCARGYNDIGFPTDALRNAFDKALEAEMNQE